MIGRHCQVFVQRHHIGWSYYACLPGEGPTDRALHFDPGDFHGAVRKAAALLESVAPKGKPYYEVMSDGRSLGYYRR